MKLRKVGISILVVSFVLLAAGFFYRFEPLQSAAYLSCPTHSLTGWLCPLCGLQQMIHLLLHARFAAAFLTNPFLFLLLPYLGLYVWCSLLMPNVKQKSWYKVLYGHTALLVLLCIALVFGILRNL